MREMQPDEAWRFPLLEMATHRVTQLIVKAVKVIRLGIYGFTQGTRRISPFWRLLDQEQDFIHAYPHMASIRPL